MPNHFRQTKSKAATAVNCPAMSVTREHLYQEVWAEPMTNRDALAQVTPESIKTPFCAPSQEIEQ
jgi:hypothetical protein